MVDKDSDKDSDKGAPAANTLNRYRPEGRAPDDPDLLSLRCQLARGRITVALGSWRASGHWWEPGDAGAWQRDEWDVQIQDGPALRLVQSGERWHVEAIVD